MFSLQANSRPSSLRIVAGSRRRLRVRRLRHLLVAGAVLGREVGRPVARIVRVREAEVDQERIAVVRRLTHSEVVEDLIGVPGGAVLDRALAARLLGADGEAGVRGLVAVALLAGPHRVVTGALEHRRHGVVGQVRGTVRVLLLAPDTAPRQVPDRAARHDHVPGRRADRAGPGPHVVGAVEDDALLGDPVEDRGLEARRRVVDAQVERRLVVGEDEQDVRSPRWIILRRGRGAEEQDEESEEEGAR
jgi:hypothetical protein